MSQTTGSGRWIDVSTTIQEELVVWPGDPKPEISVLSDLRKGDECNLSKITMSLHTGTHLDAPRHYLEHGKTIEELDPNDLTGKANVLEITSRRVIEPKDLEKFPIAPGDRLLLKTRNSKTDWQKRSFLKEFVCISPEAADYLVRKKIALIGIDYLSIGNEEAGARVHRRLLQSNILILEGLIVKDIKPGEYEMICLPLKVKGADGSPARTLIRKIG